MTGGQIVKQVAIPHACSPGWVWKPITEDMVGLHIHGGKGGRYGIPPTWGQYPKGTVWHCDCGQHWVSRGRVLEHGWYVLGWRRERWLERRKRIRLARREHEQRGLYLTDDPGVTSKGDTW